MCALDDRIGYMATRLVEALREKGFYFATAESCTGGAVSQAVTSVAGCSDVMRGGVVAYDNCVKAGVLGVPAAVIAEHGAVSREVAEYMVRGVSRLLDAECAVATTGVAGPGGGTPDKPVGTVWIAAKARDEVAVRLLSLEDKGRINNIKQTVIEVLGLAEELLCRTLFSENKK